MHSDTLDALLAARLAGAGRERLVQILRYAREFREEDVSRDGKGRFAEIPSAGKARGLKGVLTSVKGLKEKAGRLARKLWVGATRRSPKARRRLKKVAGWAAAVEHYAMIGSHAGRKLAREIARERGYSSATAERTERIVGAVDAISQWGGAGTALAAAAAGAGPLAGAAKVASYIPVGSLAYIAYSTADDPLSVWRAARKAVAGPDKPAEQRPRALPSLEGLAERFARGYGQYARRKEAPGQMAFNFDESQHPRDEEGKFTAGTGESSTKEPTVAPRSGQGGVASTYAWENAEESDGVFAWENAEESDGDGEWDGENVASFARQFFRAWDGHAVLRYLREAGEHGLAEVLQYGWEHKPKARIPPSKQRKGADVKAWKGTPPDKGYRYQISPPGSGRRGGRKKADQIVSALKADLEQGKLSEETVNDLKGASEAQLSVIRHYLGLGAKRRRGEKVGEFRDRLRGELDRRMGRTGEEKPSQPGFQPQSETPQGGPQESAPATPPTPEPDRLSGARVVMDDAGRKKAASLLGEEVGEDVLRALALSGPDAEVTVKPSRNGFFLNTQSPEIESVVFLSRSEGGKAANIGEMHIRQGSSLRGQGAALFKRQVDALRNLGVQKITTEAGGPDQGKGRLGETQIGHHVWAAFGFDGQPISHRFLDKLPPELRAKLSDKPSVQQVIAVAGKDWWREHGVSFEGEFDLSPGSESMKRLDAYLASRGIGNKPPEPAAARPPQPGRAHFTPSTGPLAGLNLLHGEPGSNKKDGEGMGFRVADQTPEVQEALKRITNNPNLEKVFLSNRAHSALAEVAAGARRGNHA